MLPITGVAEASIQSVTAGPEDDPAPITRDGKWTIVATVDDWANNKVYCILSGSWEVGDVVEAHRTTTHQCQIKYPVGETDLNGGGNTNSPAFVRKIAPTVWELIGTI